VVPAGGIFFNFGGPTNQPKENLRSIEPLMRFLQFVAKKQDNFYGIERFSNVL
jgi:hypothetical protein